MNKQALRALLTIFMCADPTPAKKEHDEKLRLWLNKECRNHGFENWVIAYHELKVD